MASARFAMIENGLGFQLVPWSPSLEREWPRSVIVHEIKRENFQLTSGWRARLGDVILFDRQTRQASPTTWEVREAQNVCISWLIPKGARAPQPLGKTSHSLLVGAILHVLYAEADKTLAGLNLVIAFIPSSLQQRESCSTRARTSGRACCRPQ